MPVTAGQRWRLDGALPWRSWAGRAGGALWMALCAAQAFHWLRYGLLPAEFGAPVVRLLWLVFVLVAAVGALLSPAWAGPGALLLTALTLLPLDLWPVALLGFALVPATLPARRRRITWTGVMLAALPCLLYSANERIYGPLTEEAVAAVMQTQPREAWDYVRQLVTPGWLVAGLAYALSLALALRQPAAPPGLAWRRVAWMAALPLALLLSLPGLAQRAQVVKNAWRKAPIEAAQWGPPPAGPLVDRAHADLDVVLLLGEATARSYWSLYGFPADTTPRLSAMRDDLLVYTDVVSAYSHTVPSLQGMFYRDTPSAPPARASQQVSLIELLRQAGVKVHWYSGQETMGPWAVPVTRLADAADEQAFLNEQSGFGFIGQSAAAHPDRRAQQALLAALGRPSTAPRLLVQHYFAGHSPYCGHVPSTPVTGPLRTGEAFFGDAGSDRSADVACYAGAMRFVDERVADSIQAARGLARPTIVVFVPDHGEAPELGTGHNSQRHSAQHVEIPLVVYFNDAARRSQADAWQHLAQNRDRPFLNQWLFELLLSLYGLPGDGLNLLSGSPAAASYAPSARILFPDDRRWDYDLREPSRKMDILSDTRLALQAIRREAAFKAPVYAHRVDTQGKALAAWDRFTGIEMDIVHDAQRQDLRVYHPPKSDSGLRLDDQLATLNARPDLSLWLDMKNPDAGNAVAIEQLLDELDSRWHLRGRTVVELSSGLDPTVFRRFSDRGWTVSVYLPDDWSRCNRAPAADAACAARAATWLQAARSARARYLSFDFGSWPAVRNFLAPGLGPDLGLLSWDLSLRSDRPDLVQQFRRLPPLDGMIIPFPTAFDR